MGQRLAVCGLPLLFLNRQQMVCFRQVAEPGRLFSRQQMHAQSLLPGQRLQPRRELPQFWGKSGCVFRQQQERAVGRRLLDALEQDVLPLLVQVLRAREQIDLALPFVRADIQIGAGIADELDGNGLLLGVCLLYTSPSPRD